MYRILSILRCPQLSPGQRQHPAPISGIYILKEPFLLRAADDLCVKEHTFTLSCFHSVCIIPQIRHLRHHSIQRVRRPNADTEKKNLWRHMNNIVLRLLTPSRGWLCEAEARFSSPPRHAKKPFPDGNGFFVTVHRFCGLGISSFCLAFLLTYPLNLVSRVPFFS